MRKYLASYMKQVFFKVGTKQKKIDFVLSFLLLFFPIFAHPTEAPMQAGVDFVVVKSKAQDKKCNEKPVRIKEFFSFGCPWCYKLEEPLETWLSAQGNTISFIKIPVVFKPEWEYYAKAYFLIQSLQLGKKVQNKIFKTIIEDKQSLTNVKAMEQFFIQNGGVKPEITQTVFGNSPSMDIELKANLLLMSKYQITAIPAFVVASRYKTDLQMAKTPERLFAILNFLVRKAKENTKDCA